MKRSIMTARYFLFLILSMLLIGDLIAQRTNVKGYYRKDGTYVRSHTRGYTAASNSVPTMPKQKKVKSNLKDSLNRLNDSLMHVTSTNMNVIEISFFDKKSADMMSEENFVLSIPAAESVKYRDNGSNIRSGSNGQIDTGLIIYISVLRYNGQVLDVSPIPRSGSGKWEFSRVEHFFNTSMILATEALELVTDYGWTIEGKMMTRNFAYEYRKRTQPAYLVRSVEMLRLK